MTAALAPRYSGLPPERPSGGQVGLWLSAGVAALGLHGALAAWTLWTPAQPQGEAAPAAVMIEMAPDPMAPLDERPEIAPDVIEQAEVLESAERPDLPEMDPLELPDPPEDLPELAQDLPPDPDMTPVPVPDPEVAIARPLARPKPPKAVEKVAEKRQEEKRTAKAEAAPAPKVAAPANSTASKGSVSPAKWTSRLMAHLERRKRYPASARGKRAEGTVYVSFTVDDGGNVLGAAISRGSGFAELDAEVLSLVRRASPVPAPPGAPRNITAPVRFNLN